jgi:hypothetical protein
MGHRDRFWDTSRPLDSPIPGVQDRPKAAGFDDTITNSSTTYDEQTLSRRSPNRFVATHREMRLEPFEKVPSSPIFSHFIPRSAGGEFSLPLDGKPASLGPGLRTASGADGSLGDTSQPSANCAMPREARQNRKTDLALAIAQGTSPLESAGRPIPATKSAQSSNSSSRRRLRPRLLEAPSIRCGRPPVVGETRFDLPGPAGSLGTCGGGLLTSTHSVIR